MKQLVALFAAIAMLASTFALAQEARVYQEGAVIQVTSVDVKDGQWENYMLYLSKSYKPVMEEYKKAGVILDYAVYSVQPRQPGDPNLYLTTVYPNMASFDGLDDRTEPLARKVSGQDRMQGEQAFADRASMREILGSELVREIKFK